jgi:hypothetical protein
MLRNWILGIILTVSPAMSFAPATLNVKVKVDPAPENRKLEWMLISDDPAVQAQSSEWDLQGEKDAPTHFLPPWKNVPGGNYIAIATVKDSMGRILAQDRKTVKVMDNR